LYGQDDLNLQRFSSIDVNAAGDVMAAFIAHSIALPTRGSLGRGVVDYYAVHYRAGQGWDAPKLVYGTSVSPYMTRVRCCFYQGDHAVATLNTMFDYAEGRMGGFLYDGTSWSSTPLYTTVDGCSFLPRLVGDNGEALWLFDEGETGLFWSTWLRDAP
jgi:hypothetical protein